MTGCSHVLVGLLEVCIAVVTGTVGCAGMTHQQERTRLISALSICLTSNLLVSKTQYNLKMLAPSNELHFLKRITEVYYSTLKWCIYHVILRKCNEVLWRGWAVVPPSRQQHGLDQLFTVCWKRQREAAGKTCLKYFCTSKVNGS